MQDWLEKVKTPQDRAPFPKFSMQLPPSEETDGVPLSHCPGPQWPAAIDQHDGHMRGIVSAADLPDVPSIRIGEPEDLEEKGAASSKEEETLSRKAMPTTPVLPATTISRSSVNSSTGANAAAEVNEDPESNQIEGSTGFYTSMRALEDARFAREVAFKDADENEIKFKLNGAHHHHRHCSGNNARSTTTEIKVQISLPSLWLHHRHYQSRT